MNMSCFRGGLNCFCGMMIWQEQAGCPSFLNVFGIGLPKIQIDLIILWTNLDLASGAYEGSQMTILHLATSSVVPSSLLHFTPQTLPASSYTMPVKGLLS